MAASSSAPSFGSALPAPPGGLQQQLQLHEEQDGGWMTRAAVAWNDFVHIPVVEDLCWYFFWIAQLLLGPLYAVGLFGLLICDLCRGALRPPRFEQPQRRAVLITGCDTGFGRELALVLYERGWRVYAGCLTDSGAADLAERCSGPGMAAVQMDVTKAEDIAKVVARVQEEVPQGLFAVVNNAGIGKGAVVDWMPMSDFRATFEVNFFSMVAMTKACLPLLKQCPGSRVVNMVSAAGLVQGQPCMAAYCASKHACEAFSTALRLELRGHGIKVCTINPSFHKTPIVTGGAASLQRAYDGLGPAMQAEYGPRYLRTCKAISNRATKSSWHPDNVVQALVRAATASNPRSQYIVGGDAKFVLLPLLNLPTALVEEMTHSVLYTRLVPARIREQGQQATAPAAPASKQQQQQQQQQPPSKDGERPPIAG